MPILLGHYINITSYYVLICCLESAFWGGGMKFETHIFYITLLRMWMGRFCLYMCRAIHRLVDSSLHVKVDDHYIHDFWFLFMSLDPMSIPYTFCIIVLCVQCIITISAFSMEFSGLCLNYGVFNYTFSSFSHELKECCILLLIFSNTIIWPSFKYWPLPSFIFSRDINILITVIHKLSLMLLLS